MDAVPLIRRVRLILEDVENPTKKGEFWSDAEIILALNAAQDIFVSYCIRNKLNKHIQGLYRRTDVIPSQSNLPSDYLHALSALTVQNNIQRFARLYFGGDADMFRYNITQNKCLIIGDKIYFYDGINEVNGILNYYKKPSKISVYIDPEIPYDPSKDFTDDIYLKVIAKYAARILGIKETMTSRDIRRHIKAKTDTDTNPLNIANYLKVYDYNVEHVAKSQ